VYASAPVASHFRPWHNFHYHALDHEHGVTLFDPWGFSLLSPPTFWSARQAKSGPEKE